MRFYQTSSLRSMSMNICIYLFMMMLLLIATKPSTIIASASSSEAERTETQKEQKKSPLAMRFSIEGPKMTYQDRTINLDYSTRDWVNVELLGYELYDYECTETLDKENNEKNENGKKIDDDNMKNENIKNIPTGNISQLSKEEDGDKIWRLALEVSEAFAGTWYWSGQTKFCVRMMLRNLPITNEHSAEVNFIRSQLDIRLNSKARITSVKLTKPEDNKIQVLLPFGGGGQAKVHDANNDANNDVNNDANDEL